MIIVLGDAKITTAPCDAWPLPVDQPLQFAVGIQSGTSTMRFDLPSIHAKPNPADQS
jgi:hypothetical protein